MRIIASLLAATLLAGGIAAEARTKDPEAQLAKEIHGRVAGAPVNCISLTSIRSTRIIDGTAIVYDAGSTIYVNRPDGAAQLRSSSALVSSPTGSQLCDLDIVRLMDSSTRMWDGSVGLGRFVPYKKVQPTH